MARGQNRSLACGWGQLRKFAQLDRERYVRLHQRGRVEHWGKPPSKGILSILVQELGAEKSLASRSRLLVDGLLLGGTSGYRDMVDFGRRGTGSRA